MKTMKSRITSVLKHTFDTCNTYRIDVYLFFIALTYLNWSYLPIATTPHDPRIIAGISFLALYIWLYLFNKTTDIHEDSVSQPNEMYRGTRAKLFTCSIWSLAGIGMLVPMWFGFPVWVFLFYALIGFLYSYPFLNGKRLKNFFLIKTLTATFFHVAPIYFGVYLLFTEFYTEPFEPYIPTLIGVTLLCFVGELLWDIRDYYGDKEHAVKTIPVVLGIKTAKGIGFTLTTAALLLLPPVNTNILIIAIFMFFLYKATPYSSGYLFHYFLYSVAGIIFAFLLF